MPDKGTKAIGIERNGIFQVGHAVGEAQMPCIWAYGDKHRVALPGQSIQNSPLPKVDLGQITRALEVQKASVQLQDEDSGNDKVFRTLWDKGRILL